MPALILLIKTWIKKQLGISDQKYATNKELMLQNKHVKINPQIISNILIKEYTKRLLEILKNDLELEYAECYSSQNNLKLHSKKHKECMQQLQCITADLENINEQYILIVAEYNACLEKIKQDLGIKSLIQSSIKND